MSEVVDTDSQALHHLLTEAGVDWDGLSGEVARQADALLGDEQAALILDESAFAKKGTASAGVARMWNGRLGKVDNSQVGVFSALCRDQRVTLLDTRLYLPKDWVEDAERCRRAHIPEEARQLRSKCELALELVDSARQHGVRFGYVAVDGGYGKDPAFLRGLETRSLCFLADVHKHQRIWLDDPAPYRPATTSRGRPASIRRTSRCQWRAVSSLRSHAHTRACRYSAFSVPFSPWRSLIRFQAETGCEAADGGEPVTVGQFGFQCLHLGQVLHQDHHARCFGDPRDAGIGDHRLVQIEPAGPALGLDLGAVDVAVTGPGEAGEQFVPRVGEMAQGIADGGGAPDAGAGLHGLVPENDLTLLPQGAGPQGQVFQDLPLVALQGVQFAGEAVEQRAGAGQPLLHVTHGIGQRGPGPGIERQLAVHDEVGHLWTDETVEVALDALAQPPQFGRA